MPKSAMRFEEKLLSLISHFILRLQDEEKTEDPNKQCCLPISTPSLEPLNDTNSIFKVRQNVSTTCIAIVEENSQESASVCVSGVDNLEGTEIQWPERWIRHYCSSQKMLLVGEGDFSFSASLAVAFGSATNMVATSLDFEEFLYINYNNAMSNIHELRSRGCTVLHGVDATKMANHCFLGGIKFDRVIYNFPHAGFFPGEWGEPQKRRNQLLLSLFFKNAKEMIHENGEIHVTHKCNGFLLSWNLRGLASAVGLKLIQELPFSYADYPGYRTKYGFGGDKNFNSNPSKTYKFGLFPACITMIECEWPSGWDCEWPSGWESPSGGDCEWASGWESPSGGDCEWASGWD